MKLHQRLDQEADALGLWLLPRSEAMPQLLEHYRRYVESVAELRRSNNHNVARDDYIASGMIGLWEAITTFCPTAGATFTTWAAWRVKGRLIDAERDNDVFAAKVRAKYNAGEISLPAMIPWKPADDPPVADSDVDAASERLADVLSYAEPLVRGVARIVVEADHDVDRVAARLSVSDYLAGHLLKWVVGRLQETPCPAY